MEMLTPEELIDLFPRLVCNNARELFSRQKDLRAIYDLVDNPSWVLTWLSGIGYANDTDLYISMGLIMLNQLSTCNIGSAATIRDGKPVYPGVTLQRQMKYWSNDDCRLFYVRYDSQVKAWRRICDQTSENPANELNSLYGYLLNHGVSRPTNAALAEIVTEWKRSELITFESLYKATIQAALSDKRFIWADADANRSQRAFAIIQRLKQEQNS